MEKRLRDTEQQFRAELALSFGLFEIVITGVTGASELLFGTFANALIFAAGIACVVPVLVWLMRGGSPDRAGTLLMAIVFTMVTIVNVGSGGRSIGANMALPILALFGVLMGRQRAGMLWLLAILAEI